MLPSARADSLLHRTGPVEACRWGSRSGRDGWVFRDFLALLCAHPIATMTAQPCKAVCLHFGSGGLNVVRAGAPPAAQAQRTRTNSSYSLGPMIPARGRTPYAMLVPRAPSWTWLYCCFCARGCGRACAARVCTAASRRPRRFVAAACRPVSGVTGARSAPRRCSERPGPSGSAHVVENGGPWRAAWGGSDAAVTALGTAAGKY